MNISENNSNIQPALYYKKMGEIQKNKHSEGVTFTQAVCMDGTVYNVNIHYSDSNVDIDQAKNALEASIRKMLILAGELKLGIKGLEKIHVTDSNVIGHWKNQDGIVTKNFEHHLTEKLEKAKGDQKKGDKIQRKIDLINNSTHTFSTIFPLDSQAPSWKKDISGAKPFERSNNLKSVNSIEIHQKNIDIHEKTTIEKAKDRRTKFNTHIDTAKNYASEIEKNERDKSLRLLDKTNQTYQKLNDSISREEIKNLRIQFKKDSVAIKNSAIELQKEAFEKLENTLVEVTKDYNVIISSRKESEKSNKEGIHDKDIENLKTIEKEMRSKIKELNTQVGNVHLSTNPLTATKSNISGVAAVLEKKFSLLEQKAELEEKDPLNSKEKKQPAKITRDLKKAPSSETINTLSEKIKDELERPPSNILVTGEKAKALNVVLPDLKWGNSHMAIALTTPANWTPMQTAVIKESRAGFMHTSVEILEPLNIDEKGGVPSGLRNKEGYNERVTNFIKTTSYIKQEDGSETEKQISYRGGQFPTKEAAKEALSQMINDSSGSLEDLHINALLTPVSTPIKYRPDSKLLPQHKTNVLAAIDDLINEEKEPGKKAALENLKERIAISNFGVNQDAVGEIRVRKLGIGSTFRLKFGWHTSIRDYSNEAVQKLGGTLSRKLQTISDSVKNGKDLTKLDDPTLKNLDRLGAIFSVGLEMEQIWATNDYAEGRGNNNQFKLPALWKTMDGLMDITTYSDCMSGKDRTAWVEGNAKEFADEIRMNIMDQKKELQNVFKEQEGNFRTEEIQKIWNDHQKVLTTACFTPEELKALAEELKKGGEEFKTALRNLIDKKIKAVNKLTAGGGLIKAKEGMRGKQIGSFSYSLSGIPKTDPKADTLNPLKQNFPQVAGEGIYNRTPIDILKPTNEQKVVLEQRQREAVNRGISQRGGSLQVIQKNTSKAGNKEKAGEPLARFASGFDREYVIYKLLNEDSPAKLKEWAGLEELDAETSKNFISQAKDIQESSLENEQKIKKLTTLLRNIEKAKMQGLSAQGKVKA